MTIRLLIFNPVTAVITLLIGLAIIWSLRQTALNTNQTNQVVKEIRQEIQTLEAARDRETQKAQVSTTSGIKEKIIRDQLLLHKPDETVLQLPALPSLAPTPANPTPTDSPWRLWQNKLLLR